jgi:hypothetical protein
MSVCLIHDDHNIPLSRFQALITARCELIEVDGMLLKLRVVRRKVFLGRHTSTEFTHAIVLRGSEHFFEDVLSGCTSGTENEGGFA